MKSEEGPEKPGDIAAWRKDSRRPVAFKDLGPPPGWRRSTDRSVRRRARYQRPDEAGVT